MTSAVVQTGRWDHVFFSTMSVAMVTVVGIGFSRTYPARIAAGAVSPLVHLHAALFAGWMLLFLAQALLVAQGKARWHRRVGVGVAFVAVVILLSGTVTAIVAVRHGFPPGGPIAPVVFLLAVPLRDMVVFAALTGAAIVRTRDVQTHKRLMLMATLGGLVPAGAGRFSTPFGLVYWSVMLGLLAAGPVYDWVSHQRVYGAYIWGIAVTLVSWPVFSALAQTSGWQSFAQALIE